MTCAIGRWRARERGWTAGVIVARQKPPMAKGFAFYVLQDGAARVQLIISLDLWEAHRQLLRDARALIMQGETQGSGRAPTMRALQVSELALNGPRISGYAFG